MWEFWATFNLNILIWAYIIAIWFCKKMACAKNAIFWKVVILKIGVLGYLEAFLMGIHKIKVA